MVPECQDLRPVDRGLGRIGGILLCGGKSSRMGVDKALLRLDPAWPTFVGTAARALEGLVSPLVLSCQDPKPLGFLGLEFVPDALPDSGPLGGIVAGLEALASCEWAFVVACDLPFVTRSFAEALVTSARKVPEADVVLPTSEEGDEPLFALYRTALARRLREALERGVRRVAPARSAGAESSVGSCAFDGLWVVRVPLDELTRAAGASRAGSRALFNVNDPDELREARRIAARDTPCEPPQPRSSCPRTL